MEGLRQMSKPVPQGIMDRLIEIHDNHPKVVKQTAERTQRIEANTAKTHEALARAELLGTKRLPSVSYQQRYEWLLANRPSEAKAYWDKWARAPIGPSGPVSPRTAQRELALKAVERAMRTKQTIIRRR
jgi:hypothetical protein